MKKIKCLVVDDEPLAIDLLKDHISKINFLELGFSTTNPLDALEKLRLENFDLVFLDIQMPELNGMDFLKILDKKAEVILTTAYSEYALESYDYEVLDYLLKPISFERFYKSVLKILSEQSINEEVKVPNFFFVKIDSQQVKIFCEDILYIESIKDYVNIKTEKQEFIYLETLKSLETKLPENFERAHKSFIVNLDKIIKFSSRNLMLINGKEIPIGETYKSQLFSKLQ